MEWKVEVDDFVRFAESTENHFKLFMKFADDSTDTWIKKMMAIITVDANITYQRYITDLGFRSKEEVKAESSRQTRSFLTRMEHLHGAEGKPTQGRDFVSGLDYGELQEKLVEIFLCCLDQDLNYIVGRLHEIAQFETLLKCLLRDTPSVSWLKWQFDLTGSAVEDSQVPDISYEDGVSCMNVTPEYDIMLSVSQMCLGLNDQENCMTSANYPGFVNLYVPPGSNYSENLLPYLTLRESKYYLSALKFKKEIYQMLVELKAITNLNREKPEVEKTSEEMEMKDFDINVIPHGPAIQIDERYLEEDIEPFLSYDVVPAIKFNGWPKCSQKWVSRERLWPPQSLVKEIIQEGFHLVPKTSPQGDEELEWRISFSKAEVKLMRAKGLGQRNYCYRMFKMAVKENISSACKLLSTYHLKTLLLWASERHPPDRWSDENIALCFLGLLDDLLHSLVNCSCPHYFIPELNLFANCSTDHLYYLASQVSAIRKSPLKYLKRPRENPTESYNNFIAAIKEWTEEMMDNTK